MDVNPVLEPAIAAILDQLSDTFGPFLKSPKAFAGEGGLSAVT
jgi:hypothetical protein